MHRYYISVLCPNCFCLNFDFVSKSFVSRLQQGYLLSRLVIEPGSLACETKCMITNVSKAVTSLAKRVHRLYSALTLLRGCSSVLYKRGQLTTHGPYTRCRVLGLPKGRGVYHANRPIGISVLILLGGDNLTVLLVVFPDELRHIAGDSEAEC